MDNNRTFFKNVKEGNMTLKDIFSDVMKKHTPEQSARVFIAGTALTTPEESEMLAGWQKPYIFARFLLGCVLMCVMAYFLADQGYLAGFDLMLIMLAVMAPVTVLLLTWELNVPRNISLTETLKLVAIGGAMSLVFTAGFNMFKDIFSVMADVSMSGAVWAPIVEEPAKLFVVYMVIKKKNYKYALNGLLVGMAVGTGFAVIETLNYIMNYSRYQLVHSFITLVATNGLSLGAIYEDINLLMACVNSAFVDGGYLLGLDVAITRAVGSFSSHGTYAAIYGAGLVLAKGSKRLEPKHLMHPEHLKYFIVACLLHAANNSVIPTYLQILTGGFPFAWAFLETVLMFGLFFLPLTRRGVNQVVRACTAHNGGRVTMAVNREVADVNGVVIGGTPRHTGGRIEFLSGPLAGQSFPLRTGQQTTIGRAPNCTIPIVGASNVSGTHCAVSLNGSMILVTDLGSTNGTHIGSQRLAPQQPTPVPDGGVIALGNQSCSFRVSIG